MPLPTPARLARSPVWQALVLAVAIISGLAFQQARPEPPPPVRRLSVSNRLLLNRAVVAGLEEIEVMLLVDGRRMPAVTSAIDRLGGQVRLVEDMVGYVRATVPTTRVMELVAGSDVAAFQIASFSRGSWYRDGPPRGNAEMYRGFEVVAPSARSAAGTTHELPALALADSRQRGYTADDVGLQEWNARHPTFDGRGVTIALLEVGLAEFTHPILGSATTLDGRRIPKLAGIANTIARDQPDETRVRLDTEVETPARSTWVRVDARTYAMPHPGRYRFGLFQLIARANLVHQFAVIEEAATHAIWVDTNGDADFTGETPIADVNDHLDVRSLELTYPRAGRVSFVVSHGTEPHTAHVYLAVGSHQTMTMSVAAGSRTDDSLASGVAPGARVLLVRTHTADYQLRDFVEGYLATVKRPDVDVLSDSSGVLMVPDTDADFMGLLFRRMADAYGKPIFHGAGNWYASLASVSALGGAFSVGGAIGPDTFAALYGGGALDRTIVSPVSAAGPALDGALKPDFVAPMHRIAADLFSRDEVIRMPKQQPSVVLPEGYQIACCTSASGPYAAAIAALLVSGARQQRLAYSVDDLARALRVGARFLAGSPAYRQGHGLLDVDAAWTVLAQHQAPPLIRAAARVVHPLAQYSEHGDEGQGLFERDGWTAGMTGRRIVRFVRETGPALASYRVSWSGNDGTFTSARSVVLPLGADVPVAVTIAPRAPGIHSALLELRDPVTDSVVSSTLVTVVAAAAIDPVTHSARVAGSVGLMNSVSHHVSIPRGIDALAIELEVEKGALQVTVLPSHGLFPNYYYHAYPRMGRTFTRGKYTLLMPHPSAGTWAFDVQNRSAQFERNPTLVAAETATYTITVKLLAASMRASAADAATLALELSGRGSTLREPVVDTSAGLLRSHRGTFLRTGLANAVDIDVPEHASALILQARAESDANAQLELHLYDCTTGECFSYDFTLPAAPSQTMTVRTPAAGRWKALVNAAPQSWSRGSFVLDEIVTVGPGYRVASDARPRRAGERWTVRVPFPATVISSTSPTATPIIVAELFDAAAQRDAISQPWENRGGLPTLADRPVSIATLVYPLRPSVAR